MRAFMDSVMFRYPFAAAATTVRNPTFASPALAVDVK
jgi:hypothetical protein